MSKELLRGVFDNNVLVSAALLAGVPRQAFDKLLDSGTVLVSVPVLLELADVLNREKFDKYVTHDERMRFMVSFLKVAEMIEIDKTITVCRDSKDDKLLELAVSGNADFLVTGDKDLLVLNPFRGVEIITPREFLDKAFRK
ncbi:MAG: putative toxin-antitoxin system toxin component, PIN family [Acidobacteriota bacterium]|nr:putative toxin-antitoxin system toxin component, PIN family [Acidobacteriota bacterium]